MTPIRGQMLNINLGPTHVPLLHDLIDRAADAGMNTLMLETGKGLKYLSHPELAAPWAMERQTLAEVLDHARQRSLQVVPLVQLFTHARWITDPHPRFAEPGSGVLCVAAPGLFPFIEELLDETLDLFRPAFCHIGHDEPLTAYAPRNRTSIFQCPRCRRRQPHVVFAQSVTRLHDFLARRNARTMMWADALLDPARFAGACFAQSGCYGGAPDNLHRAVDLIPRDVLMCDWHYEPAREFPTLRYLMKKGFDTIASPWHEVNSFLFARYAQASPSPRFAGMLATSWVKLNRANAPWLRRIIPHHGFVFSHPGQIPRGHRLIRQVARLADSAGQPLPKGAFRKVIDLDLSKGGIFESQGWRDLRYIEYDQSHEPMRGPRCPRALELRAGREGEVTFQFRAVPGRAFGSAVLRVWMRCPGASLLSVAKGASAAFTPVVRNASLAGRRLDLTPLIAGAKAFRLRLEAENLGAVKRAVLRRLVLSGEVK